MGIGPYTDDTGDLEGILNWAVRGVGLIKNILPAADIVKKITEDAVRVLENARTFIHE